MRIDEAINRKGDIARVKRVGAYIDRNHLTDNYYLFYDEDEVYHIEDKTTGKIIGTFSCNSWVKAEQIANLIIRKKE